MPTPLVWPFGPLRLAGSGRGAPPKIWPFPLRRLKYTPPLAIALPISLMGAIEVFLTTQPTLTAMFPGGIFAGTRPSRTGIPYLRIEAPTGVTALYTSSSIIHATRLVMTAYSSGKSAAFNLGNAVHDVFKGQTFQYVGTRTAPLVIANRAYPQESRPGLDGLPVFVDRLEWLCREQVAR